MTTKQSTLDLARQAKFIHDDQLPEMMYCNPSIIEAFRTLIEAPLLARIAELEAVEKSLLREINNALECLKMADYTQAASRLQMGLRYAEVKTALPLVQDGAAVPVYFVRHPVLDPDSRAKHEWTEVPGDRFSKFVEGGFVTRTLYTAPAAPVAERDGWISVDDRLPGIGVKVLAYRPMAEDTNDPIVSLTYRIDGINESPQGVAHSFECWCHPTHWMPIPAAPIPSTSGDK